MKDSCQHIPYDQPLSYGQGETSCGGWTSIPHPLYQRHYNPSHHESADAQISFKTQPLYHDDQMQTTQQNLSFRTGTTN